MEPDLKAHDRGHAIGVQFLAFVDGNVFTGHEVFVSKMKADFVRHVSVRLVVESPAVAPTMNKMAVRVTFAWP